MSQGWARQGVKWNMASKLKGKDSFSKMDKNQHKLLHSFARLPCQSSLDWMT